MSRFRLCLGLLWLAIIGSSLLSGSTGAEYTLTVIVDGVSNAKGVVGVLVFDSPRGWPEDQARAFRAAEAPAHRGSVAVSIPDLPEGAYAAVVLHDENENRKLDRKWFGSPKEQWGMSNDPPAHFAAPRFQQARFRLTQSETIHVTLR